MKFLQMLNAKRVKAVVYNLEFNCPHCGKKNQIYHFEDWCYKKRFRCSECRKVVYKPIGEEFESKF